MDQLLITIIGGVIVAIIATWLGISGSTRVVIEGTHVRKTGKWIILISAVMIFGGLIWMVNSNPQGLNDCVRPPAVYGFTLAGYGLIFFMIGKVVAWFQRL